MTFNLVMPQPIPFKDEWALQLATVPVLCWYLPVCPSCFIKRSLIVLCSCFCEDENTTWQLKLLYIKHLVHSLAKCWQNIGSLKMLYFFSWRFRLIVLRNSKKQKTFTICQTQSIQCILVSKLNRKKKKKKKRLCFPVHRLIIWPVKFQKIEKDVHHLFQEVTCKTIFGVIFTGTRNTQI